MRENGSLESVYFVSVVVVAFSGFLFDGMNGMDRSGALRDQVKNR